MEQRVKRYEAHTSGCRPEFCNGCAEIHEDKLGDLVLYSDYASVVEQLEPLRAQQREALSKWSAAIGERDRARDLNKCYEAEGIKQRQEIEDLKAALAEANQRARVAEKLVEIAKEIIRIDDEGDSPRWAFWSPKLREALSEGAVRGESESESGDDFNDDYVHDSDMGARG